MSSSKTSVKDDSGGNWTIEAQAAATSPAGCSPPSSFWGRHRLLAVQLTCVVLLVVARPVAWLFVLGTLLALAGEGLRLWSAGILHKSETLAVVGPYAHTRHPLYLGTLLMVLGACALSGRWWSPLIALPLFALFYLPTVRAEEVFLSQRFGPSYDAYRRAVPAWGWRWRGAGLPTEGAFDWQQVRHNRELGTAVVVVGLIVLFGLRFGWP